MSRIHVLGSVPVLRFHIHAEGLRILLSAQQEQVATSVAVYVLHSLLGEMFRHAQTVLRWSDIYLSGESPAHRTRMGPEGGWTSPWRPVRAS